jgi:malate dehydrogenase (oxaloacetate-decarboxylating)
MDIYKKSLKLHDEIGGKLEIGLKHPIESSHDLSMLYTPGVAEPCREIHREPSRVYDLTIKRNTVAVVTDGSAVLGLGNIGPTAAMPVMEGKAVLFKEYAGVDAFPICLATQDTDRIVEAVKMIAPGFGGINLEDISAPRCFEVEERLQDIGIPVFHDDQHGTAIVLLAALLNALKLAEKNLSTVRIVINGAGAAGIAIAKMLMGIGYTLKNNETAADVILLDSRGILSTNRTDLDNNPRKQEMARQTNTGHIDGGLKEALVGADVFIGVSQPDLVDEEMVRNMADKPIIFALSNPVPEIMPEKAFAAGAFIVGTGRSDFPNQVNNVLAFPGIFRGALDERATRITPQMKIAAAYALADAVVDLNPGHVIPHVTDTAVGYEVARAVREAWKAFPQ